MPSFVFVFIGSYVIGPIVSWHGKAVKTDAFFVFIGSYAHGAPGEYYSDIKACEVVKCSS